jgi:RimJ/RimL family protein N-acetyltransferase
MGPTGDGMKLLPLEAPGVLDAVAGWLARKENYQWLDIGNRSRPVTPALLRLMVQRDTHLLRVYTSNADETPIGLCGLSNIDRTARNGTFWGASGDKSFRARGYGTRAGSMLMTLAFRDLGLHTVNTWVVEGNPSVRIIERLGFRFVGRLRQSHQIDGRPCDRLLFDLLASEHREVKGGRNRPVAAQVPEPMAD